MTGARASIHTGSVNESIVDIGCVAGSEGGGNSENRQIATVRALPQQTHMGAKCCTEANDTVGNTRAEPKSDNCVSLSPNKPIPDLVEKKEKKKENNSERGLRVDGTKRERRAERAGKQ